MRPVNSSPLVGGNQFFLQIMKKELATTAVRKDEAIILNGLSLKVMTGHLLQERCHCISEELGIINQFIS